MFFGALSQKGSLVILYLLKPVTAASQLIPQVPISSLLYTILFLYKQDIHLAFNKLNYFEWEIIQEVILISEIQIKEYNEVLLYLSHYL